MKTLSTLLLFCWLAGVGMMQPAAFGRSNAAVQHQGYVRELLFSIPAGHKNSQIGVLWQPREGPEGIGVCGLRVRNGHIFLGDALNGAVKVFTTKGRYLFRTQGTIDVLRTIAVNRAGEIFALSGAGADTVSKFSPTGKLLWNVQQQQILKGLKMEFYNFLYPAPNGGVAVALLHELRSGEGETGHLAILDKNGKMRYLRKADVVSESGRAYSLSFTAQRGALVTVSDASGKVLSTAVLQIGTQVKVLFADAVKDGDFSLGDAYLSPNGTLYTVGSTILPTRVEVRPNSASPGYKTGLYAVIVTYTPSGKAFAPIRCLVPPFAKFDRSVTMDAQNNVYTVEYAPNVVRVIRYRLKSPR